MWELDRKTIQLMFSENVQLAFPTLRQMSKTIQSTKVLEYLKTESRLIMNSFTDDLLQSIQFKHDTLRHTSGHLVFICHRFHSPNITEKYCSRTIITFPVHSEIPKRVLPKIWIYR